MGTNFTFLAAERYVVHQNERNTLLKKFSAFILRLFFKKITRNKIGMLYAARHEIQI